MIQFYKILASKSRPKQYANFVAMEKITNEFRQWSRSISRTHSHYERNHSTCSPFEHFALAVSCSIYCALRIPFQKVYRQVAVEAGKWFRISVFSSVLLDGGSTNDFPISTFTQDRIHIFSTLFIERNTRAPVFAVKNVSNVVLSRKSHSQTRIAYTHIARLLSFLSHTHTQLNSTVSIKEKCVQNNLFGFHVHLPPTGIDSSTKIIVSLCREQTSISANLCDWCSFRRQTIFTAFQYQGQFGKWNQRVIVRTTLPRSLLFFLFSQPFRCVAILCRPEIYSTHFSNTIIILFSNFSNVIFALRLHGKWDKKGKFRCAHFDV